MSSAKLPHRKQESNRIPSSIYRRSREICGLFPHNRPMPPSAALASTTQVRPPGPNPCLTPGTRALRLQLAIVSGGGSPMEALGRLRRRRSLRQTTPGTTIFII